MKLIVIDQEGVLCETVRAHDRANSSCRVLSGAAEAIARLNHAGYRVALLQDCAVLHRGACDMDSLNRRHAELMQTLAERGARIDIMLFADGLAQTLQDLMQRLRVHGARTTVVSGSADHLNSALQAGCRAIRLLSLSESGQRGPASRNTGLAGQAGRTGQRAGSALAVNPDSAIPEAALVRVNLGAVANELAH